MKDTVRKIQACLKESDFLNFCCVHHCILLHLLLLYDGHSQGILPMSVRNVGLGLYQSASFYFYNGWLGNEWGC
jgi:hypothetical protein